MKSSNNIQVRVENQSKPASKKQLWALFLASKKNGCKHDYRNDNLTMQQASELLAQFNAQTAIAPIGVPTTHKAPKSAADRKKTTLESEFVEYMTNEMQGVIAECREALKIKSVIEDDPMFTPENKRKQYVFFGGGCGFTIIDFDKRSKVGKTIKELSSKHRLTTFLQLFLKGFTNEEKKYFKSVGSPLSAIYYQDINVNSVYEHAVAAFMEKKGVKNVSTRTYYD